MALSIVPSAGRHPITPPLSAIPEFTPLSTSRSTHLPIPVLASSSNKSLSIPSTTLLSTTAKGTKRRASDETIVSAPLKSNSKRAKTFRSSSQPPAALHRMAEPRDSATPELGEEAFPVRYTPTTGRISKAKKGLPVHYCQYGCGKVYTRAEHRKRHEANHLKDELQRIDLYHRHMEKQWVPESRIQMMSDQFAANFQRHGQGASQSDRTRASSVTSSIGSNETNIAEQMALPNMAAQMSLGLTTPPDSSTFPALSLDQQQGQLSWAGIQPMQDIQASSPEAFSESYSPSLPQAARTMSAPPTAIQTGFGASMLQVTMTPGSAAWPTTTYWQQLSLAAPSDFESAYRTVDESGRSTSSHGLEPSSGTGFSTAASIVPTPRTAGLVELDAEHLRHYHECYWSHFDHLFPIVHRSSYSPANADSELLGAMILAIGAQFSPRNGASAHSVNSFNIASLIIEGEVDLAALTSRVDLEDLSPIAVAQLQGIFLWEYFAVYRSQQAGIHKSKHFAFLYNHLLVYDSVNADDRVQQNFSENADEAEEDGAEVYKAWILRESLRRLLLACFILDTHRSTFFHQAASRPFAPDAILPQPCAHAIWTADSLPTWQAAAMNGRTTPTPTPFKINLDHTLSLHLSGRVNLETTSDSSDDSHMVGSDPSTVNNSHLTAWTLRLASTAPIRAILTVASEGFYAGNRVTDTEWSTAKSQLKAWSESSAAVSDLYTAGRVLTSYFAQTSDAELLSVGLELDWCLYIAALTLWAYLHSTVPATASMDPPAMGKGKQVASPPRSVPQLAGANVLQSPPGSTPAHRVNFLPWQPMSPPSASFAYNPNPPVDNALLQTILQTLSVNDLVTLSTLRGKGGAAPVLKAVRSVLVEGGINLMKGEILSEAQKVLAALVDTEDGRRAGQLLGF